LTPKIRHEISDYHLKTLFGHPVEVHLNEQQSVLNEQQSVLKSVLKFLQEDGTIHLKSSTWSNNLEPHTHSQLPCIVLLLIF
jgi:hypothetical protein